MLSDQDVVLTSVEQYLSEIARLPILSRGEETDLVRRARLGERQAREALLQGCLLPPAYSLDLMSLVGVSVVPILRIRTACYLWRQAKVIHFSSCALPPRAIHLLPHW